MQSKFESLSNSISECVLSHLQAQNTCPSLLVSSLCSVNVWQLANNGINGLIFICILQRLTALDFALRLDQVQQSHCYLLSSNKDLIKLIKLMLANCSFSQEDFEGSAQVLMALEGKLQ